MTSLFRPSRQLASLFALSRSTTTTSSSSTCSSSSSRLSQPCVAVCSSSSAFGRRFSSTNTGAQADAPDGSAHHPQASAPSDSTPSTKQSPSVDDQLAQKDAQLSEYKDLYIRARADYENLQKITSREKTQAKEYAIQGFARDLVSNIDVLQLALDSVPAALRTFTPEGPMDAEPGEGRKHLADLWAGVQSTKSLLEKTLARYGVTPFDPTGQAFDPNRHEAMFQAQVAGKEPNSVINCSKLGWMLRDRVLRPAQVGVNQGTDSC